MNLHNYYVTVIVDLHPQFPNNDKLIMVNSCGQNLNDAFKRFNRL